MIFRNIRLLLHSPPGLLHIKDKLAILLDERRCEPVLVMDELGRPALALNAQLPVVYGLLSVTAHSDDLVSFYLQNQSTANATVRADRPYFSLGHAGKWICSLPEGAGRTEIDAGSAELAVCFFHRFLEGSADYRPVATIDEVDGSHVADVLTRSHAAAAENTEIVVALELVIRISLSERPVNDTPLVGLQDAFTPLNWNPP